MSLIQLHVFLQISSPLRALFYLSILLKFFLSPYSLLIDVVILPSLIEQPLHYPAFSAVDDDLK